MKNTLLIALTLVFFCSCKNEQVANNKQKQTENISEADRVKMGLIIPALDALSYQLEKSGYDPYMLDKINKYLKENSVDDFLKNNEIIKEAEKVIRNGEKKPIRQKQARVTEQQEVFDTF